MMIVQEHDHSLLMKVEREGWWTCCTFGCVSEQEPGLIVLGNQQKIQNKVLNVRTCLEGSRRAPMSSRDFRLTGPVHSWHHR